MDKVYKVRTVPIPTLTARQRKNFFSKINIDSPDGCWHWTGYVSPRGYGHFSVMQKSFKAHRVALALNGVELIDGYTVDHVCRNRRCVNPKHLRQISFVENIMCGESPTAKYARLNHCKYGHPLKRVSWAKRRLCPICQRNHVLRFHRKRKLADFRALKEMK